MIEIEEGLCIEICKNYKLGKLSSDPQRVSNNSIILCTDLGKFIIKKIFSSVQAKQRLFVEKEFTDFLHDNNFPAQTIVPLNDLSIYYVYRSEYFVVYRYIDSAFIASRNITLSNKKMAFAIEQLARIHNLAEGYTGMKIQRLPYYKKRTLNMLYKTYEQIEIKESLSSFDLLAQDIIKIKLDFINKNPFENNDFLKNKLMTHGDFHAGNILFKSDESIAGIIDFEYCNYMPKEWDIAWSISWLCRERNSEPFSGKLNLEKVNLMIASYSKINNLSDIELNNIYQILIAGCYYSMTILTREYLSGWKNESFEKQASIEEWLWIVFNCEKVKKSIFTGKI